MQVNDRSLMTCRPPAIAHDAGVGGKASVGALADAPAAVGVVVALLGALLPKKPVPGVLLPPTPAPAVAPVSAAWAFARSSATMAFCRSRYREG